MNKAVKHKHGGKTTLLALQEAQDAKRLEATVQVLSQPHRRGDSSELRESALGSFVLDYACGRECYEAGWDYAVMVYRWRMVKGVQVPKWVREEYGGSGGELDFNSAEAFREAVEDWGEKIKECESAMKCFGKSTFEAVNSLIFENKSCQKNLIASVARAIHSLAICMGRFPY
jgi:hypothetical protein